MLRPVQLMPVATAKPRPIAGTPQSNPGCELARVPYAIDSPWFRGDPRAISLKLPEELLERTKAEASRHGPPYQTVIKVVLEKSLDHLARGGLRPFLLSAHKTPGRDERSFPAWTLPKVAVAVSGLTPLGWLPSRLRNLDWTSHPVPAWPALPPE